MRKTLDEHGDKLDADEKSAIEAAMERVETAREGDDRDAVESALKELEQASHKLSERLYQQPGPADEAAHAAAAAAGDGGAGDQDAGGAGADDVIEAEYEVKDAD